MNISDIMSSQVETVSTEQSVQEAYEKMNTVGFRHLPVMSGRNLVGIISNRDLTLVAISSEENVALSFKNIAVKEVMTANPVVLSPMDSIKHAMEIAIEQKFGAFPVMDHGKLVGIVTLIDLLQVCVEALERGDIRI